MISSEMLVLQASEQKLFDSMTRNHINSHTKPQEWLALFNKIKDKLGTRETMTLSEHFVTFLDSKFVQKMFLGVFFDLF